MSRRSTVLRALIRSIKHLAGDRPSWTGRATVAPIHPTRRCGGVAESAATVDPLSAHARVRYPSRDGRARVIFHEHDPPKSRVSHEDDPANAVSFSRA